jgi:hypothetical protein
VAGSRQGLLRVAGADDLPGYSYTTHLDLNEVVARVGVNYKFGAREPVQPLK